jgi:CheY-like chemotaxis protein
MRICHPCPAFACCFDLNAQTGIQIAKYLAIPDCNEMNIPLSHIVLADDDTDHGLLFEKILERVHPSLTLTKILDGQALIQYLTRNVPDLLFLDLKMPYKDGFECLEDIRNQEKLQHLPIVVYSSSSDLIDIKKSFLHKADLYMVKPFSAKHLLNALQTVLNMDWLDDNQKSYHYYINNRFVPFTATG